jgi:glycosyltransferase involved in cell wall biosynthesis
MRILMLAPSAGVRGPVPVHTPLLVEGLRDAGCEVVSEPWGRHADEESLPRKVVDAILDIARIRRVLARRPFDVMVVKTSHEWRSLLRGVPLLVAVRRRVPTLVVQFHGGHSDALARPGSLAFKLASWLLLRATDGILVLSTEEAHEYERFFPAGRYRVVANPYRSKGWPVAAPARDGTPTIIFAGRLVAEKGIFELLAALAQSRHAGGARLLVCGSGPAEAEIRERARALGLGERVVFAGYLTGRQLAEKYRTADVFVLPSYSEGFPTAITEAMDAGLPIITTRIRGMADHLAQDENALFVPVRDHGALAEALDRILADEGLRAGMSRANRQKVHEFAPPRVAREYLQAIRDIAAGSA